MKKLNILLLAILIMGTAGMAFALPYVYSPLLGVEWDAPTLNTDGTAYTDPYGYVFYCKDSNDPNFTDTLSVVIPNPLQTQILTADIPCNTMTGDVDFTVTAMNTSMREGPFAPPYRDSFLDLARVPGTPGPIRGVR